MQALPVLRLIKKHRPESRVFWWIDSALAPLLEGDPDLAGIIPFARRRWTKPRYWPEAWRSLQEIRGHRFDWVIDLQGLARSALVAWLANGGWTVGMDDPREGAAAFYDVAVPRPSPRTHAVDWYLSVLPRLGVPTNVPFDWLPERTEVARGLTERWEIDSDAEWVVLQPGARWTNKRWPVDSFADLAGRLLGQSPRRRLAVMGGTIDREWGERIARVNPQRILDLTGRVTLPEMVEWIRMCRFMVSNDTGPMHVAAALGKPVLGLFGPTDPRRTGPYRQFGNAIRQALPCSPCMKSVCLHDPPLECLTGITPDEVMSRLPTSVA